MKIKDLVAQIITQIKQDNPVIDIHLTPVEMHSLKEDLDSQTGKSEALKIKDITDEVVKEFPDAIDLSSHEE